MSTPTSVTRHPRLPERRHPRSACHKHLNPPYHPRFNDGNTIDVATGGTYTLSVVVSGNGLTKTGAV